MFVVVGYVVIYVVYWLVGLVFVVDLLGFDDFFYGFV